MAYCDITYITDRYQTAAGKTYSGTTHPSTTQVGNMITTVYNRINARLAGIGITVPVVLADSPIAYALLQDLNALGAVAFAEREAFMRKEPNKSSHADELMKEYKELLDLYISNPSMLQDAAGSPSVNECVSRTADLYDVDAPDDITERKFYRGREW